MDQNEIVVRQSEIDVLRSMIELATDLNEEDAAKLAWRQLKTLKRMRHPGAQIRYER